MPGRGGQRTRTPRLGMPAWWSAAPWTSYGALRSPAILRETSQVKADPHPRPYRPLPCPPYPSVGRSG
eukprot:9504065-Pyramimonas_sp.AAC.1